jgi:hypothetical protein
MENIESSQPIQTPLTPQTQPSKAKNPFKIITIILSILVLGLGRVIGYGVVMWGPKGESKSENSSNDVTGNSNEVTGNNDGSNNAGQSNGGQPYDIYVKLPTSIDLGGDINSAEELDDVGCSKLLYQVSSFHTSPVKPYQYLSGGTTDGCGGGASFWWRKGNDDVWHRSEVMGGNGMSECREITSNDERNAFMDLDCYLTDDEMKNDPNGRRETQV